MIAFASGTLLGVIIGAAGAAWLRPRRRGVCMKPEECNLNNEDRAQIAAEFEAHTAALHQQVSQYADQLADGDTVLRAKLRQFERGGRR